MTKPTPEHPVGDVALPDDIGGAPIESFELTMKLDTTLTINSTHWAKPGVQSSIRWRRLPSEQQLADAAAYIQGAIIEPTIQQMIGLLSQQLADAQRKR